MSGASKKVIPEIIKEIESYLEERKTPEDRRKTTIDPAELEVERRSGTDRRNQ